MWNIWHSMMTGKAVLVLGGNANQVSMAILAALSLINPFTYGQMYFPYMTVYNTHLDYYQKQEKDMLLGATNPLFKNLFAKSQVEII